MHLYVYIYIYGFIKKIEHQINILELVILNCIFLFVFAVFLLYFKSNNNPLLLFYLFIIIIWSYIYLFNTHTYYISNLHLTYLYILNSFLYTIIFLYTMCHLSFSYQLWTLELYCIRRLYINV